MYAKNIFAREKAGEMISINDPEYHKIDKLISEAQKIIAEMNTGYHSSTQVRTLFSRLTGADVPESFWLLPPFYTDFGKNIRVGENVFINHSCEFMDRGGITIANGVLFGPKVNLITIGHPINPVNRRSTVCAPIIIEENAWIGVGASIMPGITVGKNAIVSAGAVVTKNVPPKSIVAGVPAKVIKML